MGQSLTEPRRLNTPTSARNPSQTHFSRAVQCVRRDGSNLLKRPWIGTILYLLLIISVFLSLGTGFLTVAEDATSVNHGFMGQADAHRRLADEWCVWFYTWTEEAAAVIGLLYLRTKAFQTTPLPHR